ncbi:tetracycline repressor protein class B from transposon Tn10 [Clostridium saccharobutylicum]|uniref:TetR/AcrR family transcriptional regulator n=1 Tax=Clostridium saccharobutylicum TaxID=169679 RepID=UPI000983E22F|nr:TetR/AcrR family transcriptional regulator [Clostridium saccharobutylicum]AQS11180.1 tetracycline repressor protein class B from transposon Tn10 [Clostridium saccharobutylicum]MBC2437457.1 TetR/AcrR family transcriptional regulator [Clostridium saccharobutylicum]NSB89771.1 AcrR family transcriptional regulator [Clostridium saccharobutylicum]NYC32184.1 AcrR family transcriptional regulator [Clostridium saccharobutylicum]OOM16959.1 tetracycline repressor protein class B from transposon Tn10 [
MVQKRNLTKERIIEAAFLLADEIGLNQITFQKLAKELDIKYPSLYNHFANMDDLKIKMTISLLNDLNSNLMQRLIGKSGEDAIKEFAYAYRDFAFKNKTGYGLYVNVPSTKDEEVKNLSKQTSSIIHKILEYYSIDNTFVIHKSRAFRSLLHGFVSLSSHGYFQNPVNLEDSFKFMIDDFISSISRN